MLLSFNTAAYGIFCVTGLAIISSNAATLCVLELLVLDTLLRTQ